MAELLWKPSLERITAANLTRFMDFVNHKHGKSFDDYPDNGSG